MKYTAKLAHYAFDNTYTNARLFDTKAARDTYFDTLAGYTQNELANFNARDILSTDIIIKVEPNAPLFDLLNYNYCIVIGYDDDNTEQERLYFFVKRSLQESGGQIRVYLENDIIQNYWYDINFAECMINQAHLNRFIEDTDTTKVLFNCDATSDLFEREDIKDVAKRLISRQRLMLHQDLADDSQLNEWLHNNVLCWVYIFISKGEYHILNNTQTANAGYVGVKKYTDPYPDDYGSPAQIKYGNGIVCYPVLKGGKQLRIRFGNNDEWLADASAFDIFTKFNNGFANVNNIKLSIKPPFDLKTWSASEYEITTDKLIIKTSQNLYYGNGRIGYQQGFWAMGDGPAGPSYFEPYGLITMIYDDPTPIKATLTDNTILPQIKFAKTDIIGANKNILFNPKLNNADYKELRISFAGSTYMYDIQKLNDSDPEFEYNEMLTSDVTKGLLQYKPKTNDNVFTTAYGDSYNGLAFTNDLSIPFSRGQDDMFFANNKNAYLSFENNQRSAKIQNLVGAFMGGLSGAAMAAATGGIGITSAMGAVTSIINTNVRQKYEKANFDLSIDNMRSAPETLANTNGNAILANAISPLGIYVELYSALDNELKIANDISYDNGYIFNKYGNIKDYVNTRKYFNYISATITNVVGDISNEVKNLYRQILANGIKLWHTDTINFDEENYEKWLEE